MPLVTRKVRNRVLCFLIGLAVTLSGTLLSKYGQWPEYFLRLDNTLYDLRMRLLSDKQPEDRIIIVDIDEASISELGQWPWPRDLVAELLDRLVSKYGVAIVGVDILFAEADSRVSIESVQAHLEAGGEMPNFVLPDEKLTAVLQRLPVVLPISFHPLDSAINNGELGKHLELGQELDVSANVPIAKGAVGVASEFSGATRLGFFDNPLIDADGVNRRVPLLQEYGGKYYPAFAVAIFMELMFVEHANPIIVNNTADGPKVLEALEIGGVKIPVQPTSGYNIKFKDSSHQIFQYISASDILLNSEKLPNIEGKIALIGTSAIGLNDIRVTPVSGGQPGVEVHANILSNFLDQNFLLVPDFVMIADALQIFVLGLVMTLMLALLNAQKGFVSAIFLLSAGIGVNLILFDVFGIVLPLIGILTTSLLIIILVQITGYAFESHSYRSLVRTFSQYVHEDLVRSLSESGLRATLQGETRDMTVMFADIRNFTSISERLSPIEVSRLLNLFFSEMTSVILNHGGTIDKYIGDGLMAFWGAPKNDRHHAFHATMAARSMIEAIPKLNLVLVGEDLPEISIGIGLATGEMSVGNMGSDFRVSYTVIGDAVNLGARLEALTKEIGTPVLACQLTAEGCPSGTYTALGENHLKGKTVPTKIYGLNEFG